MCITCIYTCTIHSWICCFPPLLAVMEPWTRNTSTNITSLLASNPKVFTSALDFNRPAHGNSTHVQKMLSNVKRQTEIHRILHHSYTHCDDHAHVYSLLPTFNIDSGLCTCISMYSVHVHVNVQYMPEQLSCTKEWMMSRADRVCIINKKHHNCISSYMYMNYTYT